MVETVGEHLSSIMRGMQTILRDMDKRPETEHTERDIARLETIQDELMELISILCTS